MNNEYFYIGAFHTTGKLIISDPCSHFNIESQLSGMLIVKPGLWTAEIAENNIELFAKHKDCKYIPSLDNDPTLNKILCRLPPIWEKIEFKIAVDSGQAGIFDASIYPATEKDIGNADDENSFYGKCCHITIEHRLSAGITFKKGVVSRSAYGDGIYNCFVLRSTNGEIEAIKIMFDQETNL